MKVAACVAHPDMAAGGHRKIGLLLYGRCHIGVAGSAQFIEKTVRYLWPQAVQVPLRSDRPLVHLHIGRPSTDLVISSEPRPIMLYASSDGYIPDYNEGFQYSGVRGLDRIVVNPHTGSQFLVAGKHICIINEESEIGARDALRVIKQLVTTDFEAVGIQTIHASAFSFADYAIAVAGPAGAGKTTTTLAALAGGARLVANDKLYAHTGDESTQVLGWTDPIRLIKSPGEPKRVVTLADYLADDIGRIVTEPIRLGIVVMAQASSLPVPIWCEELDRPTGLALLRKEVLAPRVRWLGFELPPIDYPVAPYASRFLRLQYDYRDANKAIDLLWAEL